MQIATLFTSDATEDKAPGALSPGAGGEDTAGQRRSQKVFERGSAAHGSKSFWGRVDARTTHLP